MREGARRGERGREEATGGDRAREGEGAERVRTAKLIYATDGCETGSTGDCQVLQVHAHIAVRSRVCGTCRS